MSIQKPVAIVGIGAIMPDANDAPKFWENIKNGVYSVTDVPADRWRTDLYYDIDRNAVDKTYSKIGAWVTNFEFNPIKMRIPIPPTVITQMDFTQQWGIVAAHQALSDYGYPDRIINPDRMAVILGNANAGERHYRSTMRILLPEYLAALTESSAFKNLPTATQQKLIEDMRTEIQSKIPMITEDTMSGELSNIIAGRIANVFNFSGPNFVTDAACASSFSALNAAMVGLNEFQFDAVLTGGVDRNMGPESYVKFSKIGALSPDGSRPYADGANGFVMGEGTAIFLLKRLDDAERDGDRIYAVIRSVGSSSDGKGKGITAPNPLGQQRAIERAWKMAGVSPASAGLIEGHGTSTRVGDVVEVNSLNAIFGQLGLPAGAIALGSVKSNVGHLKGAAGAAGLLKVAYALYEKTLPLSVNFNKPNPNINFEDTPFKVNSQTRPWEKPAADIRRAGISAFGFGGTNFHVVIEEYVPGYHEDQKPVFSIPEKNSTQISSKIESPVSTHPVIQVNNKEVETFIIHAVSEKTGYPAEMLDLDLDLEADLGVDTVKQAELFAAIREHYGIARQEDLRLSDYNTLAKVIGFVMDKSGSLTTPEHTEIIEEPAATPGNTNMIGEADVKNYVLQQVAVKTGYPVEMLDLELDLEADLGVDTVKQAELFAAIREHFGVPRREDLRLSDYNTLEKVIAFFNENNRSQPTANAEIESRRTEVPAPSNLEAKKQHFRGLLFISADNPANLKIELEKAISGAKHGNLPAPQLPEPHALALPERLAIDYGDVEEFIKRAEKTLTVFDSDNPAMWQALTAQGVYRGSGTPGKVAFLFPGQGSQYVNMLRELREIEPVVDDVFIEADRVMTPLLGKPLTAYIYADGDKESLKAAEDELKNTAITQPAVLTANIALLRLLQKYGFEPDMVIGHSLGEYAALVAAGVLTFAEALEVVSARGREMSKVSMDDNGCMAAVSAPLAEVERILTTIDGYVVLANINSPLQSVIAGATTAVEAAIEAFKAADFQAVKIPVSHAFHTKIVAPASLPLRNVIDHMNLQSPKLPIAANVTGDWYPSEREAILDMLADQVASPVQFIKGAQKLYDGGARIFVEVGPKRVMNALSNDIFKENNDVTIVATNHPRKGALPSFNEALCALYSAGLPLPVGKSMQTSVFQPTAIVENHSTISDGRQPLTGSVVISGAGLGLPGKNGLVFAEDNIQRLLNGEIRIEPFSEATRNEMLNRRVTRLEKSEAGAVMVNIDDLEDTVKLAGQRGAFNLVEEFGVPEDRAEATDIATQLAIAAGIDALRDAGIPLVMDYRTTSRDTLLPNRWMLPDALKDETGVIFASAFPGLDRMAQETESYYRFEALKNQHAELNQILNLTNGNDSAIRQALLQRLEELQKQIDDTDYHFDRRFIFRILAMGHSQFAEHIGARGPNTAVNAACATTTHAVSIAEDWIRTGRCRRVIIVAGDDITSGSLSNWISTGLLASGAATTEGNVRMAALPFDRRRNGMIMGMGAAALVVESQDAVEERGMRAICELLSCQIANSAFHGTRLDINHVSQVMERVVHQAEERFGIKRSEIAAQTVFVSHETYTPARGGSAAAEIHALRRTFGDQANKVVIANTKGFTGHTMGVGVEDVIAAKALEFGIVPPIANYDGQFEPDPELGDLNLSHGGAYPIKYSLRLGAGFGSQIAMTLLRKIEGSGERVNKPLYQQWLAAVSGYPQPEMEVVQHNLRIKHTGPPIMKPVASNWKFGQGPTAWADQQPSLSSNPISTPIAVAITEQSVTIETPKVSVETVSDDEITRQVLTRVSEKTGYPMEMLDLELDLEADLGIDTVKQAELFASIREFYEIPRREDLRLSEYNTLEKVIGFVRDSIGTTTGQQIPMPMAVELKTTPEPSTNSESVQSFVLSAVAEKTGYPIEMLDLDLDLEADLGIDTVKQAELFASIREHFGIPRREDLRLSEYNTLAKVIQFVIDAQSDLQKAEEEVIEPINEKSEEVETTNTASIRRRVPIAVLRPRLDICKPTSVTFNQDSRVIVFKDKGRVSVALQKHLKTIGVNPLVLISAQPSEISGQIEQWLSEGPILGLYYLPTLDSEELLSKMDLAGWQETLESRFHNLVSALRSLPELSFLVVATRFDGLHGLSNAGAQSPISGAAAGFAKAIARERKGMTVKVVDFESKVKPAQLATRLVDETLFDPAVVEVGWEGNQRFTLVLSEQTLPEEPVKTLTEGSVFLVSGGSGGITAPIITDLAQATRGHFYLLGRSNQPDPQNSDIGMLQNNPDQLKIALMERLTQQGQKATPAIVNLQIAGLERAAATLESIHAVELAGGQATYLVCDVNDPVAISAAIDQILKQEEKIDVLIHAAGIERSRKLESKSDQEFRQTVDVKATGFFNLFKALEKRKKLPLAVVSFGSVAGRFGNTGQTDYSAANDLLTRLSSAMRNQYPDIQAVTIDWGAWAEVGMASRGHIPELMRRAGIEMLDPRQAAAMVRHELEADSRGEVILAGSLGLLETQTDPEGGLDIQKANEALTSGDPIHVMLSSASGISLNEGILLEVELDPTHEPFLKDHALNGVPLLPGVMGIEGFSIAAQHIASALGSTGGGFRVENLVDIQFLTPFKFYRDEARRITWKAQVVRESEGLVAHVTLESKVARHKGRLDEMTHFQGKVHLVPASQPYILTTTKPPHWNGAYTVKAADIYKLYFHGPSFQVLEGVQLDGNLVMGKLNKKLPPITENEKLLVSVPVLVELCLQTAGVWEIGTNGSLSLPQSIGSLKIFENKVNGVPIYAEVTPEIAENGDVQFKARVIDSKGRVYLEIENYRTSRLPYSVEQDLLIPIKNLIK